MLNKFWDWLTDTPESRELDRQIEAADIRIAEKEKQLADLQADCNQKQQEIKRLKNAITQQQKALNRDSN